MLYAAESATGKDTDKSTHVNSNELSIILTGDTMLSRNVEHLSLKRNDFDYPFSRITELISKSDISFTNLESPLIAGENLKEGLIFRADPRFAASLKRAGFTVVSLANNHILDQGVPGLVETLSNLKRAGIIYSGAKSKSLSDEEIIIKAGECSVGFLSFTDCLNSLRKSDYAREKIIDYCNTERITNAVMNLRKKADIVVVSIHWGREFFPEPSEHQKELAEKVINAGADIIAGHHPHVIQPYRRINNGHVFFSLGNFIFDQTAKAETGSSVMIKVSVRGKSIVQIEVYPLTIDKEYRPVLCGDADASRIYRSLLKKI